MKRLAAIATVLGYVAFVYFYPRHWRPGLAAVAAGVVLVVAFDARRAVERKGGIRLWWQWLKVRLRPALTQSAKEAKAADTVAVIAAIDRVHGVRQRAAQGRRHERLAREARRIGAALAPLKARYGAHDFVDFRFLDNGACFRVVDDRPYAHEDLYAILAEVDDRRRGRVTYTVRKGQMLEDKEVFPAHVSPPRFTSLRKARKVLRRELTRVVERIAARDRAH